MVGSRSPTHTSLSLRFDPFLLLCIVSLLPTAAATGTTEEVSGAAESVDTAGFWLGFTLIFVVSAVEAAASLIWTRVRVTFDYGRPCELSYRVGGREISRTTITAAHAQDIADNGLPVAGCGRSRFSSFTTTHNGFTTYSSQKGTGCSTCGGWERRHTEVYYGRTGAVVDKFFGVEMAPTMLIRRFNPASSLEAPAGLVDNTKRLVTPDSEKGAVVRKLENAIHLFVGIVDISLGVAGLVLKPRSAQELYATLKDPEAPMTFENYLTLFLLYWLVGVALLLCVLPIRSQRRSIQIFGWPAMVGSVLSTLASVALFCLGCWKIDHARRQGIPWTPMLSYWVGGATAISFPVFGVEVLHVFGVVGLGFMLAHTFNG